MQDKRGKAVLAFVALVVMGSGLLLFQEGTGTGKLRVLIVEESSDRASLPAEQAAIFTSKTIRDYAVQHCLDEDGVPAFRVFDKDDDLSKLPEAWRNIASRKHSSLPWVTIACGGKYYDGPLSKDVPTFLAELKKYGGD